MAPAPSWLVDALRADPSRTAILLDFDGTLAPIVEDPAAAVPLPGVVDALARLAPRYALVAVISGRPASYLQAHLPADIVMAGLYGLEQARDGSVVTHPDAAGWRDVIDRVAAQGERDLPGGVGIEHKGLSLTLHVRQDPSLAAAVSSWASVVAADTGLEVRSARMSAELHPPVQADKGTVVTELLGALDVACFIGDDVGDAPAFDALDALAARGGTAVRLVVDSSELDDGLRTRADALLAGPAEVLEVLALLGS